MKDKKISLTDKVAIITSVAALAVSLFTVLRDSVFDQHVLRASVVQVDDSGGRLRASILVVNTGKNYETLYEARFIYSDDLTKGGGSLGREIVGPVVVKPSEALVLKLDSPMPDIQSLRADGTIKDPKSGIHVGVIFDALTPNGELREESKIFRITEMFFEGTQHTGSKPRPGDNKKFIDLL